MNHPEGPWERRLLALVPLVMAALFGALVLYTLVKIYLPTIRAFP